MPSAIALRGILKTDALRMFRDRFLIGISAYLLFVFTLMRAAIPWMTSEIASQWDFDLTPYYPLIISYFVLQLAPLVPGIVGAFLLLESREERTVKALLVSPTPLRSYITVACVVMMATAVVLTVASGAIIGLGLPPWPAFIVVSLAAAPAAPTYALLISAIANNKVEAFAYMKLFGLGPLLVAGSYFVPEPLQWLAAIYPPYCACKAYWVAEAGGNAWPLWVLGGLFISAVWVRVLYRTFLDAARK